MEARSSPCVDCGIQLPPECMELDHVRGEKLFALSVTSAKRFSKAVIEVEIAKCDVRCPNCHRLRHHFEDADVRLDRSVAGGGNPRFEDVPEQRHRSGPRRDALTGADRWDTAKLVAELHHLQGETMPAVAEYLDISVRTAYELLDEAT